MKRATLVLTTLALLLGGVGRARADFLAIYTFDNPAAPFADSSGNGNDGTPSANPPTYTPSGFTAGGLQFNASLNEFFTTPINITPGALPQLTMGGWFNASDLTANSGNVRGLISDDTGGFDRSLDVDYRGGNNGLQWSAFSGNGVVSGGTVVANQWTFVAVSYDQGSGSMTLDVNGTIVTAATNFNGSGTSNTTIGRNPSFDSPFDGVMDNVFFSNQALTADQLENIRLNGLPNATATPEPSSLALLGIGATGLGFSRLRRRKQA